MNNKRPPLPKEIETEVLIRSRRRCCLCVFLRGDLTVKRIQIAHIDHNNSNNNSENLVALCQEHHDDYDSKRSQTKSLTASEIKHYRSQLDKIIQRQDEQIIFPVTQTPLADRATTSTPSAKLLGQVLVRTDEEMFRIQNGGRATGIPLLRLGIRAVEDEGDFDTAIEAFNSLLRVAFAFKSKFNWGTGLGDRAQNGTSATAHVAALKLLLVFAQSDTLLFFRAVDMANRLALIGDKDLFAAADYSSIPSEEFYTIIEVLSVAAHRLTEMSLKWAAFHIASSFSKMLLGIGYVLREGNVSLPNPPKVRYMSPFGDGRLTEPDGKMETLPFVRLCGYISELPQEAFDHALSTLHYNFSVRSVRKVAEETEDVPSVEKAKFLLRTWAVLPNQIVSSIQACNDEDAAMYESIIARAIAVGREVAITAREYLISERALFLK